MTNPNAARTNRGRITVNGKEMDDAAFDELQERLSERCKCLTHGPLTLERFDAAMRRAPALPRIYFDIANWRYVEAVSLDEYPNAEPICAIGA